jgi:hypothetical protein
VAPPAVVAAVVMRGVALVKLPTPSPSNQGLRRTVQIHLIIHGARIGKVDKVDPTQVLKPFKSDCA